MTSDSERIQRPFFLDTGAFGVLPSAGSELLIGLDIDGTLLRHDTSLSERVARAYRAHVDAGTHIMLVTGRGIAGTQVALRQLEVHSGYAVCSNGAILIHVGELPLNDAGIPVDPFFGEVQPAHEDVCEGLPPVQIIRTHTFDPSETISALVSEIPEAMLAVESVTEPRRLTAEFPPGELSGKSQIVDVKELAVSSTTRLTVRVPSMSSQELLARVGSLGLRGIEYAVGWSAWLDVAPEGISKAAGLEFMRMAFGVDPVHTVAVGDSGNDCEMLAWAELGIAMGNSLDYVQKFASAVTHDVDSDGAAVVLEAFLK